MALANIITPAQSGALVPGARVHARTDRPQIVIYEGQTASSPRRTIAQPGAYLGQVRQVLRMHPLSTALVELDYNVPRFVAFDSLAVESAALPAQTEDAQKEAAFRQLVDADRVLYNNLNAAGAALRVLERTTPATAPAYQQLKARYDQIAAAYNTRQQQLDNSLGARYQRAQTAVVDTIRGWLASVGIGGTRYEIGALPALFWPIVIGGAALLGLGALSYAGIRSMLASSQSANAEVVGLTNEILAMVPAEQRPAAAQALTRLVQESTRPAGLLGSLEKLLPWFIVGGGAWLYFQNRNRSK